MTCLDPLSDVLLKLRPETVGQIVRGAIVEGRIGPRLTRLQDLVRTPGHLAGTARWKTGSGTKAVPASWPQSTALSRARVCSRLIRWPTPGGPPVQPVLTSNGARCRSSFSFSIAA